MGHGYMAALRLGLQAHFQFGYGLATDCPLHMPSIVGPVGFVAKHPRSVAEAEPTTKRTPAQFQLGDDSRPYRRKCSVHLRPQR
jgi:hypothetical protein